MIVSAMCNRTLICCWLESQISFGPISWLMVSEIFPSRTRGKGTSLAVLTNFGSNAIVTFAFSPLKVLRALPIFMYLSTLLSRIQIFSGKKMILWKNNTCNSAGVTWSWKSVHSIWSNCYPRASICCSLCSWDQRVELGRNWIQTVGVKIFNLAAVAIIAGFGSLTSIYKCVHITSYVDILDSSLYSFIE